MRKCWVADLQAGGKVDHAAAAPHQLARQGCALGPSILSMRHSESSFGRPPNQTNHPAEAVAGRLRDTCIEQVRPRARRTDTSADQTRTAARCGVRADPRDRRVRRRAPRRGGEHPALTRSGAARRLGPALRCGRRRSRRRLDRLLHQGLGDDHGRLADVHQPRPARPHRHLGRPQPDGCAAVQRQRAAGQDREGRRRATSCPPAPTTSTASSTPT